MYKIELLCADSNILLRILEKINFVEILKKERVEFYD